MAFSAVSSYRKVILSSLCNAGLAFWYGLANWICTEVRCHFQGESLKSQGFFFFLCMTISKVPGKGQSGAKLPLTCDVHNSVTKKHIFISVGCWDSATAVTSAKCSWSWLTHVNCISFQQELKKRGWIVILSFGMKLTLIFLLPYIGDHLLPCISFFPL